MYVTLIFDDPYCALPDCHSYSYSFKVLENPDLDPAAVHYIQKQNSNLTEEFPELLQQVDLLAFFLAFPSPKFGNSYIF